MEGINAKTALKPPARTAPIQKMKGKRAISPVMVAAKFKSSLTLVPRSKTALKNSVD